MVFRSSKDVPRSPSLVGRAPGNNVATKRVLAREREFKSPSRRHQPSRLHAPPPTGHYGSSCRRVWEGRKKSTHAPGPRMATVTTHPYQTPPSRLPTPVYCAGLDTLPMKRIASLSLSCIMKRNGRSARNTGFSGPMLSMVVPIVVTAAASVPSSLILTYAS